MIKKLLTSSVCLMALIAPAAAADFEQAAQGSWYMRGDLGIGITDYAVWNNEVGFAAGAGIGYKYNDNLRTDITFDAAFEYERTVLGVDATLDGYSLMMNGYWDIPIGVFQPYMGAGVGYGWTDTAGASTDDDGLAIAGMAGVTINMTHSSDFDLGYKYRRILIGGEDFDDHLIRAGIRLYMN